MLIRCPLVKKKTVSPLIIIDMLIFHWTALNDVNHLPDSFLLVKELCKSSNTEMELLRLIYGRLTKMKGVSPVFCCYLKPPLTNISWVGFVISCLENVFNFRVVLVVLVEAADVINRIEFNGSN